MNLWRRLRTELAGTWRSLRYDLGRRPPVPDTDLRTDGPDVTCTGMCTFGVPIESMPTETGEGRRARRPLAAVSVFVLLSVVGAAASYLAVVNGLGSLLREKPAAPRSYPMAVASPGTSSGSTAGLGRAGGVRATPYGTHTPTPATGPETETPAPEETAAPPRTSARPEMGGTPPVPTPTAPSTDPSEDPSPSSAPSRSDSPSATPPSTEPSAEPSSSDDAVTGSGADTGDQAPVGHRRRHRY